MIASRATSQETLEQVIALRRHRLSRLRDLDPPAPVRRYEKAHPGELLHIDIKKLGCSYMRCPTKEGHATGSRANLRVIALARSPLPETMQAFDSNPCADDASWQFSSFLYRNQSGSFRPKNANALPPTSLT